MLDLLICVVVWAVGGAVMILLALLISLLADYDRELEWRRRERERAARERLAVNHELWPLQMAERAARVRYANEAKWSAEQKDVTR